MIREIEKPEIDYKFYMYSHFKFYYDEENREYFFETKYSKVYFNLEGNIHRIGKPAVECCNGIKVWRENGKIHRLDGPAYNEWFFYLNDKHIRSLKFAEETKHLVCGKCEKFCKQECFI